MTLDQRSFPGRQTFGERDPRGLGCDALPHQPSRGSVFLALKAAGYTTGLIFADWAGQVVPEHAGRRAAEAAVVRRLRAAQAHRLQAAAAARRRRPPHRRRCDDRLRPDHPPARRHRLPPPPAHRPARRRRIRAAPPRRARAPAAITTAAAPRDLTARKAGPGRVPRRRPESAGGGRPSAAPVIRLGQS